MKKVYICSPCRGDYENNIQRAKEYSRAAAMKGCIPIAPHIYLTQFMDDTIPAERELALSFGRELVLQCDELWAFGLSHPSAGMAGEIEVAKAAGIPVLNGFEEIGRVGPAPAAAPDPEPQDAAPARADRQHQRRDRRPDRLRPRRAVQSPTGCPLRHRAGR